MISKYILKTISRINNSINIFDKKLFIHLLKIIPKKKSHLSALSNAYYYNGNYRKQIDTLFKEIEYSSSHKYPLVNLGYCSSFIYREEDCEYILYKINKGTIDSVQIKKLKINILLRLNKQKGEKLAQSEFIESCVKPNIKKTATKPILFFHIPKCGGTTVKKLIGDYFYKGFSKIRPSYINYHLLKYCLEEIPHEFPFLSSSHLDVSQLAVPDHLHYKFTIVRDPIKRTMSAFRQSYNGLKNGHQLKVIPKYGSDWYYWGVKNYLDWLQKTPQKHVLRQLSTFSPNLSESNAKNEINKLDKVILLSNNFSGITSLFDDLHLPLEINNSNKKYNKSPKNVPINEEHINRAKIILKKELYFLKYIKSNLLNN